MEQQDGIITPLSLQTCLGRAQMEHKAYTRDQESQGEDRIESGLKQSYWNRHKSNSHKTRDASTRKSTRNQLKIDTLVASGD